MPQNETSRAVPIPGDSQMARRNRDLDRSSTPLGHVEHVEGPLPWLPDPASGAPSERPSAGPVTRGTDTRPADARARILWADDNADTREYVQRLLAPVYDVVAVGDGPSALREARARPPDLVLSDIVMPGMDGVELLRLLRQDPATSDIPVILVSARAGEESRLEGLRTGADDYLAKPFAGRELLGRVGARLELARVRRDSEQRVRRVLESISDAFQIFDAGWRLTYMNPAAREVFAAHGHDPDGMIGKHFWDDLFPESRDGEAARHMLRAMTERVPVAFESNWVPWDTWYFCRFDPLPDGGLANHFRDITQQRRAESALRRSEERFRRYFDLNLIGMAITSPTKGCLEVNDRMCEILGYGRAELLRLGWAELTHPDDLAADVALFERVLAGEIDGYEIDKRWIRKDGAVVYTTISVSAVRRSNGAVDYFVALASDITARKLAEEALRASEERYRALVSQVKDYAIFSTDKRGIVTTWNEGCHQVLGYAEHEFLGLDSIELFTAEDRAAGVPARIREAAEAGSARNDCWMLARGGRRFYAMGAKAALRDADGRLIGYSTVIRDVTQMKHAQDELAHHGESLERLVTERTDELEKTTARLRLSERMASLGTLSAGLGHDMGNLLLPMDVRLQLLLQSDLPGELREHVLGIQKSAQYLQRLSNGLRLLAIDPSSARSSEQTEMQAWWSDVGMMLRDVLPRGVRFEQAMPEAECWLAIGRAALTQAVFNLVQNAADALREAESGLVRISVDDRRGRSVVVRVSDDGPGMSPEVLRRCTEPYFSTKPRAVATGMGLAFVQGLVTKAGGRMAVTSRLGHGTTICLTLRRAGHRPAPREPWRPRVALIAMRDARVRSYIAGELRALGFEVRRELLGEGAPCFAVVDPDALARLGQDPRLQGARILLLGGDDPSSLAGLAPEIVRLGPGLDPEALNRALRDAAEEAGAFGRR
jgi:PAS domain S-box-containing protein